MSAGVMNDEGKTSVAPVSAAAHGMPQAFAWNIGTTGRQRSRCEIAFVSTIPLISACNSIERCE